MEPLDAPTDPSTYGKRDLLLLTQLLHMNGLIDPSSVTPHENKLTSISQEWFHHASTQLSIQQGKLHLASAPSPEEICHLYTRLLETCSNCSNTTDLANFFYYGRMDELQAHVDTTRTQFSDILHQQ